MRGAARKSLAEALLAAGLAEEVGRVAAMATRGAPRHRSDRHEDSCGMACNAGWESGGTCDTYVGRHR